MFPMGFEYLVYGATLSPHYICNVTLAGIKQLKIHAVIKDYCDETIFIYTFELLTLLLLEVQVMRPLPSPRQVQSTTIQPWYGFSQVSPTT